MRLINSIPINKLSEYYYRLTGRITVYFMNTEFVIS